MVAAAVINTVLTLHLVGLQVLQQVQARLHRMREELEERTEIVVHQLTGAVVVVVVLSQLELQQ
jgi:hypothetical protein